MSDGQLAVIGLGSIGSMALWRAPQSSASVVGFEAATPAHPRSAVGGDTRLFRMTYRGDGNYYPVLHHAQSLWRELEQQSGQSALTQSGGLDRRGRRQLHPGASRVDQAHGAPHQVLDRGEMERRYPRTG